MGCLDMILPNHDNLDPFICFYELYEKNPLNEMLYDFHKFTKNCSKSSDS